MIIAPARKRTRWRTAYVLYHVLRLLADCLWLRLTGRLSRRRYGQRVRQFLERMGVVWIRAGQIIALRSDVFSVEFCNELSQLKDKGFGIPFDDAKRVIETELSASIERYFDEFEQSPFNVTTVSQVHMAHLRGEDVWVAVNVQRPDAEWIIRHDAALIRCLVRWLTFFPVYPNMRWNELCEELDALMSRELDYRYEASSLRRLRKKLRKHGVYVHRVFRKYSRRRVLVTEFIRAALMSDYIRLSQEDPSRLARWLTQNNIDPEKLSRCLFKSVFRQIFEDNLFHADLTPEHVILLRDSSFSILDTRSVGSLEAENLAKHRMFFEALVEQNYTVAADLYLFLASRLPAVDIAEVRSQLIRAFRTWETRTHIRSLPFREKSISRLFHDLNQITFQYAFETQWSMSRLARTWSNLDASLECLTPHLNYLKEMRKYFRNARRRSHRDFYASAATAVSESLRDANRLPAKLAETDLFRKTILRRQAQVFQGSTDKIGFVLSSIFATCGLVVLLAGLLLTVAFLQQHTNVSIERIAGHQLSVAAAALPRLGFGVWIVVLLVVSYLYLRLRQVARSLRTKEVRIPEPRAAI